jgi:hypothetical protein
MYEITSSHLAHMMWNHATHSKLSEWHLSKENKAIVKLAVVNCDV